MSNFYWFLLGNLAAFVSVFCETFGAETTIDFSENWKLSQEGSGTLVFHNVTIPTSVHSILKSNGVIDDPYFGFNDYNYRWIAVSNWTFSLTFDLDKDTSENVFFLEFDGVDTISDVYFNDEFLGRTTNMFRPWKYEVFPKLGTNEVKVLIESAVDYASGEASKYPYTVPRVCPPDSYRGFCHANFIRKEPSSFSWDWGPGFAPQGLWKPVRLHSTPKNSTIVQLISTNILKLQTEPTWVVNFTFSVENQNPKNTPSSSSTVKVALAIPELGSHQAIWVDIPLIRTTFSAPFFIDEVENDVKLWYPNGYGHQKLYQSNVTVKGQGVPTQRFETKLGFRQVKLVQNKVVASNGSKAGLTFYFEINSVPIFAKGSNWIPADAFQERVTEKTIRELLEAAKLANMNMLRVWGGGVYETDQFYDVADELGIMVWQDMMFACSMYPVNEDFLQNVREEVREQVSRLQHHPSIVIWAGNNENEIALAQNWYSIPLSNMSQYKEDYVELYVDTIQTTIQEWDSSRPFVTSSPSNGLETISENYLSKNPWSEYYGDVHVYDYVTDCFDLNHYPVPRFASEYGFQSWPSYWSIKAVTSDQERKLNSDWFNERNHHPNGNDQIMSNLKRHFGYQISANKSEDLKRFMYLTQLENALCIQTETEHYMRHQGNLDDQGRGLTMGAMYWQLNDIWPAPTWASIDYSGKWKMLHNYAQNFFEPVHVFGQTEDLYTTDTKLHVIASSSLESFVRADLEISLWMLSSYVMLTQQEIKNVIIRSRNTTEVAEIDVNTLVSPFQSCSARSEFCYLQLTLRNHTSSLSVNSGPELNQEIISTNYVFFKSFQDQRSFLCAHVQIASYRFDRDIQQVIVEFSFSRSAPAALFFWIDFPQKYQGYWTDNGVTLRGMPPEFSTTSPKVFVVMNESVNDDNVHEFVDSLEFFYLNQKPNCYEYVF